MNINDFSKISERVVVALDEYSNLINNLYENPSLETLKSKVKLCKSKVNSLLEAKRRFFQQKIRNKYLLQADRGSKYFHSLMRKSTASTFVAVLKKPDGSITTSQSEGITEFQDYFKKLIGSQMDTTSTQENIFAVGNILSDHDRSLLADTINDDMIKQALFHIGEDKTPGPDGYSSTFFNSKWDFIKEDFLAVVHEFFS